MKRTRYLEQFFEFETSRGLEDKDYDGSGKRYNYKDTRDDEALRFFHRRCAEVRLHSNFNSQKLQHLSSFFCFLGEKLSNIRSVFRLKLPNFGGLVLGYIEADSCK